MKNMKKSILATVTACTFVVMMMGFNITTSVNGTNFSFTGLSVLANGSSGCGEDGCEHVCCGSSCRVNEEEQNYCLGDGDYTCCE